MSGFFLPWETQSLPEDVRRELFLRLTAQIAAEREDRGITEEEVVSDFAASRRR